MAKENRNSKEDKKNKKYFIGKIRSYGSKSVGRCHIEVPKEEREEFPKGTDVKISKL